MQRPLRLTALLAAAASSLAAQRILVVDANGSSPYRDIQPAVDAAVDDDVVMVLPGAYSGFRIVGKGIRVLGQGDVRVSRSALMRVENTAPHQRVVVAGMELSGFATLFVNGVSACQGPVLLERMTFAADAPYFRADGARDLRLSSCTLRGGTVIGGSEVTITDSYISYDRFALTPPAALGLSSSNVTLSRCRVFGQFEFSRAVNGVAIGMSGGTLTLTGDGTGGVSAGAGSQRLSAIAGAGVVVRDPRVPVVAANGAPPVGGPTDRLQPIPTLRALGAPPGGTVQVDLSGAPGEPFVLVVGLPVQPIPLPIFGGSLGVGSFAVVAQGALGAMPYQLAIPVTPGLPPGFNFSWQAAAGDTQGGVQLSNVATYTRPR